MLAAPLPLASACTLLVGTTGLTGGSDADAGRSPDTGSRIDADDAAAAIFAEDWESKPTRWTPEPELAREDCSTTFQRETILAGGGRIRLVAPIAVKEGAAYCLVAWVRGSSGTQPFVGIFLGTDRHWLLGRAGYDNDFGGTVVPIVSDGKWRWYSAPFVARDAGTLDITDELFREGEAGAADFDDIRVYAGACPTAPTGAPHACP